MAAGVRPAPRDRRLQALLRSVVHSETVGSLSLSAGRGSPAETGQFCGSYSADLLRGDRLVKASADELSEDALLAELGLSAEQPAADDDITVLRNVRTSTERREAEEIADRTSCKDFAEFQPLFEKAATYLLAGVEVVATYKLKNVNRVRMENEVGRQP